MPEDDVARRLESVRAFLMAGSQSEIEGLWPEAEAALQHWYPSPSWVTTKSENVYGPDAHRNLYQQEMPRDFRDWLSNNGVDGAQYADAVGSVQYASAQMHLSSVMPERRANRGWRVRAIGFPSLGLIAVGLSSNYQGTQSQNSMGIASARIRDTARSFLEERTLSFLEALPSATSEDWDERGLMPSPITSIGPIDISGYDDGSGAKLRMVRNTTVKKELSTFFAIRGMTSDEFEGAGGDLLLNLRSIAGELGRAAE